MDVERYFQKNQKVLLAISGGVDSVVLFHLLLDEKVDLHCAHVNFQLRKEDSNEDEKFVKELCERNNVPLKILHTDTKKYAKENKYSIQESAREIRYRWFEELMREMKCNALITAHHKDDSIETFFINLVRGTGLKGLTGIKTIHVEIFRPLLFASKEEIEKFAQAENISFQQDASNFDDKYLRNNLRKNIIPKFKEAQNSFAKIMVENMDKLSVVQKILEEKEKDVFSQYVKNESEKIIISKSITKEIGASHFLYVLLSKYGFNKSHVQDILANPEVGRSFYSVKKELNIERESFVISSKSVTELESETYWIQDDLNVNHLPISLKISVFQSEKITFENDNNIVNLNRDKLQFPLQLRLWNDGDKFQPLGMKGKKLVSDFLREQKVFSATKRQHWVIVSGEEIAWVVGQRIGNSYRIKEDTSNVLKLKFNNG
ncbi:MAG: tRNA(Ile)-lysidine synthase [Patiriisocius sp.]|jgi:tRNA(Ile)-lysidine synthase